MKLEDLTNDQIAGTCEGEIAIDDLMMERDRTSAIIDKFVLCGTELDYWYQRESILNQLIAS